MKHELEFRAVVEELNSIAMNCKMKYLATLGLQEMDSIDSDDSWTIYLDSDSDDDPDVIYI